MKLNPIKLLGFAFLVMLTFTTFAQTKIAPPPVKLDFGDLSKKGNKDLMRRKKLSERVRSGKVSEIKKYLKKNTDLSKEQLEKYVVTFSGLDTTELVSFKSDLQKIKEEQQEIASRKEKYDENTKATRVMLTDTKEQVHRDSLQNRIVTNVRTLNLPADSLGFHANTSDLDSTYLKDLAADELDLQKKRVAKKHNELEGLPEDMSTLDTTIVYRGKERALSELDKETGLPFSNIPMSQLSSDSLSAIELAKAANVDSSYFDVDELINVKLKGYMEKFVSEKVSLQQFESMIPLGEEITSSVKHYIPDLEELNYSKPKIPTEKLKSAMVLMQKERKKEEIKDLLKFKNEDTSQEKKLTDRFEIGGFLEFKPQLKRIELTPSLSFGLNKVFSLGLGYQTVIRLSKSDSASTSTAFRSFIDFKFYKSYFLHSELEWAETKANSEAAPQNERNFYLGLGKSFRYKFIKTSVLALYNFNAPSNLRTKPFTIRFEINFSK